MPSLRAAALPALLLLLGASSSARTFRLNDVAAVMSPSPGPYQAAFGAFKASLGGSVMQAFRLPAVPAELNARVVVAFGGEAARLRYADSAILIACLAPGAAQSLGRSGRAAVVSMKPSPERLLSEIRRVQPGLKKLAVLARRRDEEDYLTALREAGAPLGVEILPAEDEAEGIPGALRSLVAAKPDAVWLAPDPVLVTPENFRAVEQFSWDNDVPFYAPTRGLAEAGATAAVFVSPEEQGRTAAELARRALAGEKLPAVVYPDKTSISVNAASALKAGLRIDARALGADVEALP